MNKLNLSFDINFLNINDFLNHWETKYKYNMDQKYDDNIGKPLNKKSRLELYEWKNGTRISKAKIISIEKNYPLIFNGNKEERYLNYKESGGAIWNIFYLHCLEPQKYPIYDQHTYRAMYYMKNQKIKEIGRSHEEKYLSYMNEYKPFIKSFEEVNIRKIDRALFSFGRFLKIANKYT
ncbi:MAG: hypothetical protein COA66_09180 [Arcobacter sp.]|nr:MAG: hypothetical protein COA66_09180 [Arcobacter sp.]